MFQPNRIPERFVILITGGLGFLGCNLAKLLCDGGEKVLLTSNRNTNVPPLIAPFLGKCLRVAPLDITSLDSVSRAIQEFRVKSIVHAAVRSEKGDTTLYQAMDVNVTGTINVLEASRRADIRRVLFISSEAVYQGMDQTTPFKEEEKLFITSDRFVPGTKKTGEILCLMYCEQYGMEAAPCASRVTDRSTKGSETCRASGRAGRQGADHRAADYDRRKRTTSSTRRTRRGRWFCC
jgi:nucleoside-diphosphate-sugar epimerase